VVGNIAILLYTVLSRASAENVSGGTTKKYQKLAKKKSRKRAPFSLFQEEGRGSDVVLKTGLWF